MSAVDYSSPDGDAAVPPLSLRGPAPTQVVVGYGFWLFLLSDIVLFAVLFAGYAVLAIAYALRYSLLIVLAITAPLAALLFVLPDTHHYARKWGSLFVTTLLMQPLQLLILQVGLQLDLGTAAWNPGRHLFALATLLLAFKVPGALHATSTVGTHAISTVKHYAHLVTHGIGHVA